MCPDLQGTHEKTKNTNQIILSPSNRQEGKLVVGPLLNVTAHIGGIVESPRAPLLRDLNLLRLGTQESDNTELTPTSFSPS